MRLCLTLAESRLADLQRKIDHYADEVSLIEVRFDHLAELGMPRLPAGTTHFIATCRPLREGGMFAGSEAERIGVLHTAAQSGFHWIDLEHDVRKMPGLPLGTQVVRSMHCFDQFPPDPGDLLDGLTRVPGDLVKLAVAVSSTAELTRLLRLMESLPSSLSRVLIGMGPLGQPARFLGSLLGNRWTYVAETQGSPVAPGQFDLERARACLDIGEDPVEVYGVLGRPVGHSLSPLLHNGLFRRFGLKKVYFPFELDDLEPWFQYVQRSRLRFSGFSVTIPFKRDALRFASTIDSTVGAINTMSRSRSGWAGSNTDLEGFLKPLRDRVARPVGGTALVLGCGGVARTVVRALMDEGWKVTVTARNRDKASLFAAEMECRVRPWGSHLEADLLVNTTPVGQHPHIDRSPLDDRDVNFAVVYDLVYHPRETLLLRQAKRRGARIISGVEMFLEQAALQFRTWTGMEPDRVLMGALVEEALTSRLSGANGRQ